MDVLLALEANNSAGFILFLYAIIFQTISRRKKKCFFCCYFRCVLAVANGTQMKIKNVQ